MAPPSHFDECAVGTPPPAAGAEVHIKEAQAPSGGIHAGVARIDAEQLRRAVARCEANGDRRLAGHAGQDHELCEPARQQPARAIRLVEILAGPRAAADRNPRAVGIHDELLPRQSVVALGTTHLERARTIDGERLGNLRRQGRQRQGQTPQFLRDRDPDYTMKLDRIGIRALLQRATELAQRKAPGVGFATKVDPLVEFRIDFVML